MAAKVDSDSNPPSVQNKAVYTVLRFIGDKIKDDSTSDDSKESLEGVQPANLTSLLIYLFYVFCYQLLWSVSRPSLT